MGESGTDYGPSVVLDSTLLDNLTDDERVEMVKLYIQSIEGQSFTAHDKNGNPVDVKVEESRKKFKNKSGKRVSVNRDLLTKNRDSAVKQESIVLVDELISAATEGQHTSPQYSHGWLDNYGLNPWQEWTVFVQDKSGMIWRASLQIATATNGEKILYDIFPIKKVERRGKSRTISTVSSKPQVGSEVKSQNQRFDNSEDSAGNALTRQQAEFFADSEIRDAEGRLKVMYRGGNGDFTVFMPLSPAVPAVWNACGTGKTYLACALGNAANRNYYETKYIRLPDLLVEIALSRIDGTYRDVMKKYKKPCVLILDEWLLYPLKETEARDLLEIIEARNRTASTIFCSQFDIPGWHEYLYDPTLADAICDRIIHDSHIVTIKGDSMRKLNTVID